MLWKLPWPNRSCGLSTLCPCVQMKVHPQIKTACQRTYLRRWIISRQRHCKYQRETKEEDYMPTPFVPELQKKEEVVVNTVTRHRRGRSRRGRQRRDFQRDILPGLTSLSRHEVTENIHTFEGIMRATKHRWVSRLARRNGTRNGGGLGWRQSNCLFDPLIQHRC